MEGKSRLKAIVVVIVIVLVLIVLIQNAHVTTINILFWRLEMSQVLVVIFSVALGFVLGLLSKFPGRRPS